MLKTETLDELFGIRDDVSARLVTMLPKDPAEEAQTRELLKRRDRLTARINEVIAAPFTSMGKDLELEIEKLEAAAKRLAAVRKSIDEVSTVIGMVDETLKLAASIVGLAR